MKDKLDGIDKQAVHFVIVTTLIILSTSYLTLGIFAPDTAASVWAYYGVISFSIGIADLVLCKPHKREEK